jgi:hypothetical protein
MTLSIGSNHPQDQNVLREEQTNMDMFKNPKLYLTFVIVLPALVLVFGRMGWGTNNVFPAIVVTALLVMGGSRVLGKMSKGTSKGHLLHFLFSGQTASTPHTPVVYQPQHLQTFGFGYRYNSRQVVVTEEGEEFDDEEYFEGEEAGEGEEFDDEEYFEGEEAGEGEEFDDEEYFEGEEASLPTFSRTDHLGERNQRNHFPQARTAGELNAEMMQLARDLVFHLNLILSGRVSIFGLPNSGKSNLIAKICEELGRLIVPFVLADTEDEYSQLVDQKRTWLRNGYTAGNQHAFGEDANFPPHFIPVDREGAYYFGKLVLEHGFQVVLNLESYDTEEEAALVMCEVVRGMRDWEQEHPPDDRVSCFFILEEAATWLPQNAGEIRERLTPQTFGLLQTTMFNTMVRKGRKRGLGFIFASQRPAEIDKRAMKSSWRFLLWQSEKADLDYYEEMCPHIDRDLVQKFQPGECVAMGPGILTHTRIYQKRSPDCAKTPGLESIRRRYGGGQVHRFHTTDLARILRQATLQQETPANASPQHVSREGAPTEVNGRVVQFPGAHPSQQPQPNTDQQLAWGCAVLKYLSDISEPFTVTAVRRPRKELRPLAVTLEVIKPEAVEIIGGGSRAERIQSEVENLPSSRFMELLGLASRAQQALAQTTPEVVEQ